MDKQPIVNLTHKVPTVVYDNFVIQTKTDGQTDLLFYQLTTEGQHSEADVVAAVRVPHISKLKAIRDLLSQAVEEVEKQEP